MARIVCTQMDKVGKPLEAGKTDEWGGWHYAAIVSAVLHDLGSYTSADKPDAAYMTHLGDWLASGDDIDIMYLTTPYGLDIWQYDSEESE